MIQVGLLLGDDSHSQTLRRFLPAVAKRGVEFYEMGPLDLLAFRQSDESFDCGIIHQALIDGRLPIKRPFLLIDNKDGADLCSVARKTLCSEFPPSICWKKSVYVDPWKYNRFHGRWHELLIEDAITNVVRPFPDPPMQIPVDRIARIKAPFGYGAFDHPQKILAYGDERAANADRPIDVCFAGWMEYGAPLIQQHRELCVEALSQLPSKYRVEVHRGRPFQLDQYADMLFQSKVVVSPYGLGECCFRDSEGVFAGCVVIKPDVRHVSNFPLHIQCGPDFADLEAAVESAIYSFTKPLNETGESFRLANRRILIDSLDVENVADQLYADIVQATESR
jgi:hypothetical protein